jgi:hypothetical protein
MQRAKEMQEAETTEEESQEEAQQARHERAGHTNGAHRARDFQPASADGRRRAQNEGE